MAIAVATARHVAKRIGCLTLFVTHYPEVALLQEELPGVVQATHMTYRKLAREGDSNSVEFNAPRMSGAKCSLEE